MRMLLVEDNRQLAEMLTKGLQAAGYDADHLTTSAEACSVLTTTRYAALILDLGLPDGDGLSILRELRDRKDPLPILVLTARASLHDRVSGLRSGADDYLVKPFDFDELVARLEALLRRPGRLLENSLQVGNLTFDTESRQVFIDDIPQVLFAREATVLELLMRHKGRVVSKKLVEDHIFGSHCDVSSNAVEVYVHRLRRQLSSHGAKIRNPYRPRCGIPSRRGRIEHAVQVDLRANYFFTGNRAIRRVARHAVNALLVNADCGKRSSRAGHA